MVYYNLKLTLRNIWRHKTFSFINIVGLTVGITSCMLIGVYAYNELSFDKFHSGHNNIYRINKITSGENKQSQLHSITPGKLTPSIRTSIPEVDYATVFRPWFSEMLVSYELDVTATRDEEIRGICKVTMTVRPTFSIDYIKVVMFLG